MTNNHEFIFCKGGGCGAKLGPAALSYILDKLPRAPIPSLLVGYDHGDDGSVYKINDTTAIINTLDFFPPMLDDPYIFGQIAATNALSDVYAMGGEVLTALNIVCFPENQDLNILGQILIGGNEKVVEAGGCLAGGHSINDLDVKYGLSVTGIVHPDKIYRNNTPHIGDILILTKPLGVGLVMSADRMNHSNASAMQLAIKSMTTLNMYVARLIKDYPIHACTDVTGFSLMGHMIEMVEDTCTAIINASNIPYIEEAYTYAEDFYYTAAGQRNRNHCADKLIMNNIGFGMEELLYDPQTSGGLLLSVDKDSANDLLNKIKKLGLPCNIIGQIVARQDYCIIVNK